MRQAPVAIYKNIKPHIRTIFIIAVVSSLLVTGLIFIVLQQGKEELPTLDELVITQVSQAVERTRYSLEVEESGPGYSLRFTGQVVDGKVYGKIDSYDLEIYSSQNTYFVRGSELYEEWEEMKQAELGALSAVIREPLQLLEMFITTDGLSIDEGPIRTVDNAACKTYFLEVPPPDLLQLTRFDDENASLDKLELYLWFNEEEDFLYRMALLLNVTVEDEKMQINRIYNMHPDAPDIPNDLPKLDGDYFSI